MAKRVLVVAGREGVAPALQVQIELWGDVLDLSVAASGNEALWEVRGSPYDLVLAPWQLPEMTGIEFAEVVQALSPATKVVLVAVPVTPALRNRAKTLGVYALLAETSPQEVAVLIGRALDVPLPRPRPIPQAEPPPEEEPEVVPEPELTEEVVATQPELNAQPTVEPTPEAVSEPSHRPAPERVPEVVSEPTPERVPEPVLEPTPEAAPELAVEPPPLSLPAVEISLTAAQQAGVRRELQDLLASVGPQIALLISTEGEVLVSQGSTDINLAAISAHVVTALSGADDLAELLDDESQLGLSLFVGERYDIYAFTVTEATILLLIFDKAVVESKLGSVWLYTRRVVDELRDRLS